MNHSRWNVVTYLLCDVVTSVALRSFWKFARKSIFAWTILQKLINSYFRRKNKTKSFFFRIHVLKCIFYQQFLYNHVLHDKFFLL